MKIVRSPEELIELYYANNIIINPTERDFNNLIFVNEDIKKKYGYDIGIGNFIYFMTNLKYTYKFASIEHNIRILCPLDMELSNILNELSYLNHKIYSSSDFKEYKLDMLEKNIRTIYKPNSKFSAISSFALHKILLDRYDNYARLYELLFVRYKDLIKLDNFNLNNNLIKTLNIMDTQSKINNDLRSSIENLLNSNQ